MGSLLCSECKIHEKRESDEMRDTAVTDRFTDFVIVQEEEEREKGGDEPKK